MLGKTGCGRRPQRRTTGNLLWLSAPRRRRLPLWAALLGGGLLFWLLTPLLCAVFFSWQGQEPTALAVTAPSDGATAAAPHWYQPYVALSLARPPQSGPFTAPVAADWRAQISSPFGVRENPTATGSEAHTGVDIAQPAGTEILAIQGGQVLLAAEAPTSYGRYLLLDHGGGRLSLYGHCQTLLVKAGETVTAGQTIARVGSSGRSTGNHLHLELVCQNRLVDPCAYLP